MPVQMDSSAFWQIGNVMDSNPVLTEVMNIPVFVEQIVALWKEGGLPVQMDSSASGQKINVMEEASSLVMMVVMRAPTLAVVIFLHLELTRATAWETACGRETSAPSTVIRGFLSQIKMLWFPTGKISTTIDSVKA